jgi:hypothetical protein
MATVFYRGTVQVARQVDRLTVSAVASGAVLTATIAGKVVSYTCTSTDTTSTAAQAMASAIGTNPNPEVSEMLTEIDPASSSAILVTGPADGAPFTMTASGSGGGTIARTSVTSPTGPHHADAVGNYSSGALPAASDVLIFQDGEFGPKYALTALAGIALASVRRFGSFSGQIGLPPTNGNGYAEYRPQFLQLNCASVFFEQTQRDQAYLIRIQSMGAMSLTVSGSATSTDTDPVVEVHGLSGASSINCAGASIGVALRAGQTATATAINASDSSISTGTATTLTAMIFTNCVGFLMGAYDTCRIAGNSTMVFAGQSGSALSSGVGLTIDGGQVAWRSTARPGPVVVVSPGASLDLSLAPAVITTFAIDLHQQGAVNDSAGRIATPIVLNYVRCNPGNATYIGSPGRTHTIT